MTGFPASSRSKAPLGVGNRLLASLFFLFFFGMGSAFVWLIAREAIADLQTWTWSRTVCEIARSSVRETNRRGRNTGDYFLELQYSYRFGGGTFTSTRYRLKTTPYSDYGKVARLTEKFQPGSTAICYVNPAAPGEAVLQRGSLFMPLLILFPMIFVAIGAIGIYTAWRTPSASQAAPRPLSDRATPAFGIRFATLFFGVFAVMGCILFYFFSARPFIEILSARQWPEVPCTIISSAVKSHSGNHGSTYSVNILYSYAINDREFKANRYDFMGGSSSGYQSKQAIVSRYHPGSKALCYVNPSEPTEAVLERGFTPLMWVGLLPLVFVLLGFYGMVSTVRKGRAQVLFSGVPIGNLSPMGSVIPQFEPANASGPLQLKPKQSPSGKLLVILVFALFWNGLVSVFLMHVIKGWRGGHLEWFLAIFLIPFVLVGLGLIAAVVYFFLGLFNPRPHLTVSPGTVVLGGTMRVEWEVAGRVEAMQSLKLRLQGREEATYTRGTTTTTDRSVFADLEIATMTADKGVHQVCRDGDGTGAGPHFLRCSHNKIVWFIQVHGEITRWPDVQEEFPVTVLPGGRAGGK
jgi:hypothetical protein